MRLIKIIFINLILKMIYLRYINELQNNLEKDKKILSRGIIKNINDIQLSKNTLLLLFKKQKLINNYIIKFSRFTNLLSNFNYNKGLNDLQKKIVKYKKS
jgi:hypothetical protein